jgi:hypothetical protein
MLRDYLRLIQHLYIVFLSCDWIDDDVGGLLAAVVRN